MTLIDLKMDLAHTNSLLERITVALETIAREFEPPVATLPRKATMANLHQISNKQLREHEEKVREALGLSEDEWEYGGRR